MDRRSVLKLFGAGAAVVPLVGGVPDFDAHSLRDKLIADGWTLLDDGTVRMPLGDEEVQPAISQMKAENQQPAKKE